MNEEIDFLNNVKKEALDIFDEIKKHPIKSVLKAAVVMWLIKKFIIGDKK